MGISGKSNGKAPDILMRQPLFLRRSAALSGRFWEKFFEKSAEKGRKKAESFFPGKPPSPPSGARKEERNDGI